MSPEEKHAIACAGFRQSWSFGHRSLGPRISLVDRVRVPIDPEYGCLGCDLYQVPVTELDPRLDCRIDRPNGKGFPDLLLLHLISLSVTVNGLVLLNFVIGAGKPATVDTDEHSPDGFLDLLSHFFTPLPS